MPEIDPMIPSQFASEPQTSAQDHPTEEQDQKQQQQQRPAQSATVFHQDALLKHHQHQLTNSHNHNHNHNDNACSKHHSPLTSTNETTTDTTTTRFTSSATGTTTAPTATATPPPEEGSLPRLTQLIRAHPILATFLAAQVLCSGIPVCLFLGGVLVSAFVAGAVFAGFAMLVMGPVLVGTGCLGLGVWGFGWGVFVLGRVVGRVVRGESLEGFGGGLGGWGGVEDVHGERGDGVGTVKVEVEVEG
ncbi:hypothetical protein BP00DRAFT_448986 [Aspergillus indologenus CBS 114.80]|uniref:Uncharacterized protein n=1 Tax=Aspergillus indologenus CBS 114.80 TaxID=1450541 RepID=A0A2V5HWE9_9EURO|nr:hypothetical protein BP00DRAFT_448986 [Aspergillus indologenus CBS 114.80]